MYSTAHYYIYVRVLHGCILHVRACTNVRCIAFTYHLLVIFFVWFLPIWPCALCNLYWGRVHVAKLISNETRVVLAHLAICIMWPVLGTGTCCKLISTHIISLLILWLHVLYISGHILYQPIWPCALCSLYWEQVHSANLYRHILYHFWLYDCMYCTYRDIYYISSSGCVHYVACIGNRYTLQTYIDTYYITSDYMTACIIHIGAYITSARLAVCIM